MKKLILFISLLVAGSPLFSQVSEEPAPGLRKFGFGLHLEPFLSSATQIPKGNYPYTTIVFTYNVNNKIRLEPKMGFIKHNAPENKSDSTVLHLELGGLLMTQHGKTNVYYGISTGYDYSIHHDEVWNNNYHNITNRFSVGPKQVVSISLENISA